MNLTENQVKDLFDLFENIYPTITYETYKQWITNPDPRDGSFASSVHAHASRILIKIWDGRALTPRQFKEIYKGYLVFSGYNKGNYTEEIIISMLKMQNLWPLSMADQDIMYLRAFVCGYLHKEEES